MSAAKIWYASGTLVIITCVYRKNGRYVLKTIFSSFFVVVLIRLIQRSTIIYIILYCICARHTCELIESSSSILRNFDNVYIFQFNYTFIILHVLDFIDDIYIYELY